jgi:Tfp pilus assembly protein PilN
MNQDQGTSEQVTDEQVIYVSIGIVLVILISSLVIYGIGYGQSRQAANYENKIAAVEEELADYQDVEEEALALGVAQKEIDSLYAGQKTYDGLVSDLSDQALKNISLSNVSIDSSAGTIQIQGLAKSYLGVNKQVVSYSQSEWMDNIQILSATDDSGGNVQFSLSADIVNN